jgi:hypothetical protein
MPAFQDRFEKAKLGFFVERSHRMRSCTNKRERALLKERDSGTLCKAFSVC